VADDIVRAEVRPLIDKHYGTEIVVRHPSGRRWSITVWIPFGAPSDEELASWDVDRSMWESNVEVSDGWGETVPIQSVCSTDNHYQSEFEAAVAKRIAAALDGWDWEEANRD
jgi:hypothetical protein